METNYDYDAIGRHLSMFTNFWKDPYTDEYISIRRVSGLVVILAIAS